ncbi:hypothetical protein SAMD00023353_0901890 [Rosellinia necatrix]|uniref:Uncharacterized protein n=1 Tax=Rosellinia necatrix TaxID=77044 RepID=A0A1W2TLG8_ROSNE|nr:hypothetical protein SAMD00023353_0901890 [Rosellinia necatrix]
MTMENASPIQDTIPRLSTDTAAGGRKRSGSGGSILSRFSFLRSSESKTSPENLQPQKPLPATSNSIGPENASERPQRALAAAMSQQKTRRRRGSLRKVALLGRGAAREKRESKLQPPPQQQLPQSLVIDTSQALLQQHSVSPPVQQQLTSPDSTIGLGLSDATPRPPMERIDSRAVAAMQTKLSAAPNLDAQLTSPTISYTSTTDEEDGLSVQVPSLFQPNRAPFSSGSESYYHGSSRRTQSPAHPIQRRRSTNKQQYAKSPLSLQGLATGSPALGNMDGGYHDYGETEWWGWVVLVVTWFVFVLGMGSCLNIWSWSWDVGSTPYAPPELEDDPTLPIVGYYPALMILTSIMAWVWVIVAWVGMKYFRHAKISGD